MKGITEYFISAKISIWRTLNRTMGEISNDFLIRFIIIIAVASVATAFPSPGVLQPTGIFTRDPNPRRQLQPTGILTPDPNVRRQLQPTGIFALDPNHNTASGTTIYPAGPDANGRIIPPGFATLNRSPAPGTAILAAGRSKRDVLFHTTYPAGRTIPDGIYPAGGTTFRRPLQPTGIFTTGATTFSPTIPNGIYPAGGTTYSRPLQPTGIFTTGGASSSRPLQPTGVFTTGTSFSRPLQPTGIFTTGGSTYSRPLRPTGIYTVG